MPGPGLAIARNLIAAWNAGDLEALYANFDPAIVARPDPDFPEGAALGEAAARRFWEDTRDSMGFGHLQIDEEHDLDDRSLVRVRQEIHSRSGVESSWAWSVIFTVREGKVVMVEFFIDHERAKRALGL